MSKIKLELDPSFKYKKPIDAVKTFNRMKKREDSTLNKLLQIPSMAKYLQPEE